MYYNPPHKNAEQGVEGHTDQVVACCVSDEVKPITPSTVWWTTWSDLETVVPCGPHRIVPGETRKRRDARNILVSYMFTEPSVSHFTMTHCPENVSQLFPENSTSAHGCCRFFTQRPWTLKSRPGPLKRSEIAQVHPVPLSLSHYYASRVPSPPAG